jgi:hypothetical protein
MATVAHWTEAQLAVQHHSVRMAHAAGSWPERVQRMRHGTVLTGASAAKCRQGLHLDLLLGSSYKLQHGDLGKGGWRVVLTGEAV